MWLANGARYAIHHFNRRGLDALRPGSSPPKRTRAESFLKGEGAEALREMLHHSPTREFGKESSLWTLEYAAEASFERGLTAERRDPRDSSGYLGEAGGPLGAGQAVDREPRSRIRKEKGARDRLIRLAEAHREWALGFEDETWFSRFERPSLHSWADATKPVRLVQKEARKDVTPSRRPSLATGCICPSLNRLLG